MDIMFYKYLENLNFRPYVSTFPSWSEKPWLTGDGPSRPISYFPKELFEWEDE